MIKASAGGTGRLFWQQHSRSFRPRNGIRLSSSGVCFLVSRGVRLAWSVETHALTDMLAVVSTVVFHPVAEYDKRVVIGNLATFVLTFGVTPLSERWLRV